MEQTKNEPTKENKAAPDTGKPKKGREPLTEAQRLKRQKMIVLPAMVLVFIGAMWLIFAPSSGKEQPPGTDGYNTEMPDADKANKQIIGDKLKAYEHGEMEERQESRNRTIGQLSDMFDREIAGTEDGVNFDLANPGGKEERAQPAAPQTIQSSAAAYRDLNATLGNFYEQPKNDNAEMDELLERIASLESELESEKGRTSSMDEQVALMEKSYELAAKYMGGQNGGKPEQSGRAFHRAEGKEEQGNAYQTGGASSSFFTLTAYEQRGVCRHLLAGTQPGVQHGCRHYRGIGPEHHTGVCAWGAERDGWADSKASPAGAYGGGGQDNPPQCGGGRHGQDTGGTARHRDYLAGI